MKRFQKRVILGVVVLILLIFIFYCIGLSQYFSLESIKIHAADLKNRVVEHYYSSVVWFMLISTLLIALTLPVTGPVAVIAGFLFGLLPAVIYTMVASIIGTMISFLVVRHALLRVIKYQYGERLTSFKKQLHAYGYTYLISLQLLMIVPYFVINTLAALAGVPLHTFMWTTALGTLPIIVIYAFAGRQLYMIQSWKDILSMNMLLLLIMLALLALLPMLVRKLKGVRQDILE